MTEPDLERLLADALAAADPGIGERIDTDPQAYLDLVSLSAQAQGEMERQLGSAVGAAREAGWSWERIGSTLNMSRQAAQQRFGSREDESDGAEGADGDGEVPTDPQRHRLSGLTAFDEVAQLDAWGRHGWHSVGYGLFFHDLEHDELQWEHKRVFATTVVVRGLEGDGWTRIGSGWFPWVYLKRRTDVTAETGIPA